MDEISPNLKFPKQMEPALVLIIYLFQYIH